MSTDHDLVPDLDGQTVRSTTFGGLDIAWDARVLQPRTWTLEQSLWAASLLPDLPRGPVLELCCGAGQIGLRAVVDSDRHLVCVDAEPVAAAYTLRNARTAGLGDRVEIRVGWIDESLEPDELFPLIIADPPRAANAAAVRPRANRATNVQARLASNAGANNGRTT